MHTLTLRTATPADVHTLAAHAVAMAYETEQLQLDLATVTAGTAAILADAHKGFYLLALDGAALAGSLLITYEYSDWRNAFIWWIQSVYVAPMHRGRGVYKLLYQEVKRLAQAAGVPVIRLYVEVNNRSAQQTYEKLGMTSGHYVVYEDGVEWPRG